MNKSRIVSLISLFILSFLFSGAGYCHGPHNDLEQHQLEDAILAAQAEEQAAASNAVTVMKASFSHVVASLPKTLLSDIVNALVGKQVNAAVGDPQAATVLSQENDEYFLAAQAAIPNPTRETAVKEHLVRQKTLAVALAVVGNPAANGEWSALRTWPFAFASAANLPDGRILAWGANNALSFNGGNSTFAAIWDPVSNQMVNVNHPNHSLFCGTPVMLEDGTIFVAGGDTGSPSVKGTSTFNYKTQTWTRIQDLSVGRWYNGAVFLPNGKVFTALGQAGNQYPEVWTPGTGTGTGWSLLTGANLQAAVLDQVKRSEPVNWLPHFHLAPNGKIFHSGHTPPMHYIDPIGNGSLTPVGLTNTWNTSNTPSVLYDVGKILQTGGVLYDASNVTGTGNSYLLDLNGATPTRTVITGMQFPRVFHNEVVLPNGEVMVIGGNTSGLKFNDVGSQMTPEIWNPVTKTWRPVANIAVPRTYHSVALLMTDGRVWSGGGGICGTCTVNHPDSQVYTPPYLFNSDGSLATRPVISNAPNVVSYGRTIDVVATPGLSRFSLLRMTSTTHALNSDMHFLNVPFTQPTSGNYRLTLPTNPNVMVPGYWMLFALNAQGVPSVAKVINVSTSGVPTIVNPGDRNTLVNNAVTVNIQASDPNGDTLTYSATGLPQGLTINATGVISGTPTVLGTSNVVVSVKDAVNTATASFVWNIVNQGTSVSPVTGGAGGTAFTDIVTGAQTLTGVNLRAGFWLDSIQGILNTGPLPAHGGTGGNAATATLNPGEYLVRSFGLYGTYVGQISFVTNTGRTLGPYGTGQGGNNTSSFNFVAPAGNEIVGFTGRAATYLHAIGFVHRVRSIAPVITGLDNQPIGNRSTALGAVVNSQVNASGTGLTYTATGLPPGLSIAAATGLITGTTTTAGTYNTRLTVQNASGTSAPVTFDWTVSASVLEFNPITTAPKLVNTAINFTASVTNATNPQFKWLFGDNTPETAYSTTAAVSHAFTAPGLYTVKVTAKDASGIENSATFRQAIHALHTANKPTRSSNMTVSTNRLYVVNQDNDTVSVFDTGNNAKLAEIAVGKSPRAVAIAPDGRVWVTSKAAGTLSIINPANLQTAPTTVNLPFASQPFGLAFAPDGSAGYVVLEATGKLLKLNPTSGAVIATVDVGANPRHLAVTADSGKVLVSRFITPPLSGENTAVVQQTGGGQVVVINAATMVAAQVPVVLQYSDTQDTNNTGSGFPNYLAMAAISPDGLSAWVPSKQDNLKRGTLRNGANLNFENSVRAISSKIDLNTATFSENLAQRIDHDNASLASAATFDQSGNYLFVALETSREIAIIDAYGRTVLPRVQVGRAPDGLAISADGQKLYVNNFMDRTVSVVDLNKLLSGGDQNAPVTATLQSGSAATEKLAANVLKGKQLFYDAKDPRLSADAYLSCATCHNDGGHDGRVWDFTGFGEGLRTTIDLRGRGGLDQGFLHWTANFDEVQDFEGQIRNFAGGTGLMSAVDFAATQAPLGAPKAGKSVDLDAMAAYVSSLKTFATSPFRNPDDTLTAAASAGKVLFGTGGCAQCHGGAQFTDSSNGLLHDVGTLKASSGKRLNATLTGLDTPTLRDVWNTAPYLHDGSAATLFAAIKAHTKNTVVLSDADATQVATYLQQIGGSETVTANTPPVVAITAPTNGSSFAQGTAIPVTVSASDTGGSVTKVELYAGATLIGTDTAAPYDFSWTGAAPNTYTLTAKAYDNGGAVTTSGAVSVTVTGGGTATTSPLFGGPAGTAFTDTVAANQSLTGVNVRSGGWLDSVQGVLNTGTLPVHGGVGGNLAAPTLNAGEYLVGINGSYGTYVGVLNFVTNTGRVLGPYGTGLNGNNATPFTYTVPAGNEIVGFTGRASTYLNAIGVVFRPRAASPVTSSPIFGSAAGTTFTDPVTGTSPTLTGVNVRSGWWLDSIQGVPTLPAHGGVGGILANVAFPAGEYLVGINGAYGTHVGIINFVTKNAAGTLKTYGPFGTGQGGNNTTPYTYTVPDGNEIVGFTGRAGTYLEAIGVMYRAR